jgi:hypothetical protein
MSTIMINEEIKRRKRRQFARSNNLQIIKAWKRRIFKVSTKDIKHIVQLSTSTIPSTSWIIMNTLFNNIGGAQQRIMQYGPDGWKRANILMRGANRIKLIDQVGTCNLLKNMFYEYGILWVWKANAYPWP